MVLISFNFLILNGQTLKNSKNSLLFTTLKENNRRWLKFYLFLRYVHFHKYIIYFITPRYGIKFIKLIMTSSVSLFNISRRFRYLTLQYYWRYNISFTTTVIDYHTTCKIKISVYREIYKVMGSIKFHVKKKMNLFFLLSSSLTNIEFIT